MSTYIIQDWTGRNMNYGTFTEWDDAEAYLCEKLDDAYETDRQEYFITEVESC